MALDTNRILIFVLLLALLYTLYKYQQDKQPVITDSDDKKRRKHKKKKKHRTKDREVDTATKTPSKNPDLISVDNVSQYSLGSLNEVNNSAGSESNHNLAIESFKSPNSSNDSSEADASIFNESVEEPFFFQQR